VAVTSTNGPGANGSKAMTVLVVEDDFFIRQETADYLNTAGYDVLDVATGEDALELCHTDTAIDVLVTDINLPGLANGWDVAQAFRDAHAGIAVIYASGHAIDHARCVPGSRFFSKPYRSSDILAACRQMAEQGS
jgi:two-component system, OmpR family, response regulator